MSDPDDDALSWAGDEPDRLTESSTARPAVEAPAADTAAATASTPAPLLLAYGVVAGIFLIYTIGWVVQTSASLIVFADPFANIMWQLGEALAIAAPALWLVATFLLTRGRRPAVRLLWLAIGLIVLLPWPTFTGGL